MTRFLVLCAALRLVPLGMMASTFSAADSTNRVGLDLFRELRATHRDANVVLSPYSIENALALAYAGADSDTRAEMSRVLHLPDDEASVHAGFAALRMALQEMAEKSSVQSRFERHDPIDWRVANRLFGEREYPFRESFLALMRDDYQAPFQALDFRHATEQARGTINDWVAEQTANRIRDLIPPRGVDADTRLVLVNALYLKAPWQSPFRVEVTKPQPFHFTDGVAREVATMRTIKAFGYLKDENTTVVTLPYVGGDLQFVIILPDPGVALDAAAQRISGDAIARWAKVAPLAAKVDLSLPKLRLEPDTLNLVDALRKLGMRQAFDQPPHSANFERMAPRRPDDYLLISEVFHRTFVAVDEKGTEAAAATAIAMLRAAALQREAPIEVRVDRPFLFAIQQRSTGVCLFLGQVTDPR